MPVTDETWARCTAAIEALPEPQKTAMALRYEQSMSDAEIAAVLNMPVDQVTRMLQAAIETVSAASGLIERRLH